jgi:hypothetical protein
MRVEPAIAIHEVREVGDRIAERTTLRAERHAAIHAPPTLRAHRIRRERAVGIRLDLLPIREPLRDRPLLRHDPLPLDEPGRFTHGCSDAAELAPFSRPFAGRSWSGKTQRR